MPLAMNYSGAPLKWGFIVAAKGQYVWLVSMEGDMGSTIAYHTAYGFLISVSAA